MAQAVGIIDIVWKGARIAVEKGATFKLPGEKNNTVVYGRGAARSQEYVAGHCKCTTILLKGQKVSDLYTSTEGELQIHCDTGQIIVSYDAWLLDRPEVTGGEGGKVALEWNFATYEEIS